MPISINSSVSTGKRKLDDSFNSHEKLSNLANIIDKVEFGYNRGNTDKKRIIHEVLGSSNVEIFCPADQSGSISLYYNEEFMWETYSTRHNLQLWYLSDSGEYEHLDLMNVARGKPYVASPQLKGSSGDTAKFELWYKTYHAYNKIIDIRLIFDY